MYERRPRRDAFAVRGPLRGGPPFLHDADELTVLGAFPFELDLTIFFREQGVVATDTHIFTGVKTRATLTHNDITGNNNLTAVDFDAQAFTF